MILYPIYWKPSKKTTKKFLHLLSSHWQQPLKVFPLSMDHLKTLLFLLYFKWIQMDSWSETISKQDKLNSRLILLISCFQQVSNPSHVFPTTILETTTERTFPKKVNSNPNKLPNLPVSMIYLKTVTCIPKERELTTLLWSNILNLLVILKRQLMNMSVKSSWMEPTLLLHTMFVKIVYLLLESLLISSFWLSCLRESHTKIKLISSRNLTQFWVSLDT